MFRLRVAPWGEALLISERDNLIAGTIEAEYVEAVSQALGIGIPVIVGIGDGKSTTFQCSEEVESLDKKAGIVRLKNVVGAEVAG